MKKSRRRTNSVFKGQHVPVTHFQVSIPHYVIPFISCQIHRSVVVQAQFQCEQTIEMIHKLRDLQVFTPTCGPKGNINGAEIKVFT